MTELAARELPARSGGALDGVKLHLVDNVETLLAFLRWSGERRETPIAGDTESGGLSPYHHRMRLVQVGDMHHGWAFPEGWWGAAVELLFKYPAVIFHNSPYDWRVIKRHASTALPWEHIEDTLTAGHICDSLKLAGLKARSALEVDRRAMAGEAVLQDGMSRNRWTWDTVPINWEPYWCYAALDPVLAAHLWNRFGTQVTGKWREAYDLEKATARISAEHMMDVGLMIDLPYIRDKMDRISTFHRQAMAWLRSEFGISTVNSSAQVMQALNAIGIPTQVWSDSGQPSISKEALNFYLNSYPEHEHLIKTIRYARKAGDINGKYLQKFLDLHVDGIMHYTINTCRARTSRQSVTDPPMQTFDRDEPVIRGSFIPRPGHRLVSIDADQIEMRLAAHFSEDRQLIQDFLDAEAKGESFFVTAASRMFNTPISKKDPRYTHTKNASYGQIYGAGLDRAAATAGLPIMAMRPIYMGFQNRYPGVGQLMQRLIYRGKHGGRPYAEAIDGRYLYVNRGHEYAILNTMIQGSAAVILKRGLIDLDAHGFGPYLRLTIHDEFLFEFPEDLAEQGLREATRILTDRDSFRVPITWGGKVLDDRWVKT